MDAEEVDRLVRTAAFGFLERETGRHGEVLPFTILSNGFEFGGRRVPLLGPQGIFKPSVIPRGMPALTITTAPPRPGKPRPYDDRVTDEGLILYRYRGTDPNHPENAGLRLAMHQQTPLIYLHGLAVGQYSVHWPVFIVDDDPGSLSFVVAIDEPGVLRPDLSPAVIDEAQRRYVTRLTRQRIHQLAFRQRVLRAYRESCAVCKLRHPQLLDAAHIVPDSHERGEPRVTNGLSLCKLHHSAFDTHVIGIRPDLVVEVRRDILEEADGPMLQHGIKDFEGRSLLIVPYQPTQKPDPAMLEIRYDAFRRAG